MGGIADIITGESNRKASRAADRTARSSERASNFVVDLGETILSLVKGAAGAGQFDPQKQIDLMNESSYRNEGLARQASAGTARILGYRPGDSTPMLRDRGISESYDLNRRQQEYGIRQDAFQRMLQAYQAAGMGGQLVGAGQNLANLSNMFLSRMQDPSALLNAAAQWYTAAK